VTTSNEQTPETEPMATDQTDVLHPSFIYPQLRNIAEDHHVLLDDDTIHAWADNIMARHTKASDAHKEFTDYVRGMAQGLYPTLAPQIASGMSVRHLLEPYRMVAKSVLGHDVEPNWNQPNWNKALAGNVDQKTGRPSPMSLEAWRQELLSNPEFGWHETDKGKEHIRNVMGELHRLFSTPGAR